MGVGVQSKAGGEVAGHCADFYPVMGIMDRSKPLNEEDV